MRVSFLNISFALCATLVAHLGNDLKVQASTSSLSPACNATSEESVGDGACDIENNNGGCEYDGGDCCPCTCVDALYHCGTNGYDCQDPAGSDACATASPTSTPLLTSDEVYVTASPTLTHLLTSAGVDESQNQYPNCSNVVGYIPYIGDGYCDNQNNNEMCGFDGGDCCACTCEENAYSCGVTGFTCRDPTVPDWCTDATSLYPNCSSAGGYSWNIDDGYCDGDNNIEECGYDGGDCCNCTCTDSEWSCGIYGYDCQDPSVSIECVNASMGLYPNCADAGGLNYNIDDGNCNDYNNNEECGYDGGDCCNCTCTDSQWSCGMYGYDCQDPSVSIECVNASVGLYPNCDDAWGSSYYIGNGYCNGYNNIEECGYDGGDCCACTCIDSAYTCGSYGYDCQDPTVPLWCVNATSRYPDCADAGGLDSNINDGYCQLYNNKEECAYDGGDCCACTCVDSERSCGSNGYHCQDPTVPEECINATSQYPDCAGVGGVESNINDGYCHWYNNNEECGYDGGDCCACTCVDGDEWSCGIVGYDCQDPTVPVECLNATSPSSWASTDFGYYGYYTYGAIGYPNCVNAGGYMYYIGDGWCDSSNNNADCGYDGGDCCLCTCKGSYCEYYANDCLDPTVSAACTNATELGVDDDIYSDDYYDDYNYYYFDDDADADDVDDYYSSCAGTISYIGDGYCDSSNNNEDCEYDGGDCCPCTCVDASYSCGWVGYDCQDPTATSDCSSVTSTLTPYTDYSETYPDCEAVGGVVSAIGSGYCLDDNNNEECGYDGGDCCPCTCIDGASVCGSGGYDCQDPTASTDCSETTTTTIYSDDSEWYIYSDDSEWYMYYDDSEGYPDCEAVGGSLLSISDGFCSSENNNEECGYDGGDCCPCTCVDGPYACGYNGYDCEDPTVTPDCFEGSDSTTSRVSTECMGDTSHIGNGECDVENNNAYCDFDGGDCCSCTCVDSDGEACGDQWYDCQDPGTNCSARIRTVGVAIITGVSVFVAMLMCFAVSRRTTALRTRRERFHPILRSARSGPTGPAGPEAVSGVVRKPKEEKDTYSVKPSDPSIAGSCVVKEGKEEEKTSNPEPSAPPLPSSVQSHPLEIVRVKAETSAPKSMIQSSSPLPEGCSVGNEGSEEKTWDPKPSVAPLANDAAAFEEAGSEEAKSDLKSMADPSSPLPESSAVEDVDIEETTGDLEPSEASLFVDADDVGASGVEKKKSDLVSDGDPLPTLTEGGDDVGDKGEEEKETPDPNSPRSVLSDDSSSGEAKSVEGLMTLY